MNLKKIFNFAIVALVTITMSSNSIVFAKDNSAKVVSDWQFDSNYVQEGTSFEQNNLILKDASGNGNDLIVNTERVESGKSASDYMEFVDDSIDGESESLLMSPKGTSGNDKKIGAFFQTVENAPITHETFDEGYTFEFIIKLSDDISGWSSIFGKRGIAKQNGLTGGEPEVNGGLNVSSSGELQWNFYTNNPEIKNNPTTWSDAGGIQRNKFHHIVVKNDSNVTTMIVDGIVVLRCNTTQNQRGLADLGLGWVVGTAYWSDAEIFDEKTCGDSIFKGQIQEIRLSSGLVAPDDYLVTEHIVDDAYNISGNNNETNFLETKKNYNFAIIPDPQYTTQYKPVILDAQNEWIAENANDYNIAMTLGVGDITQDGTEAEFKRASESYSIFDEKNIPYLLTDGNHDSNIYLKYFGAQRYENINLYQANISKAVAENKVLVKSNENLKKQVKDINSQIAVVGAEQSSVNGEIAKINQQIANKQSEIQSVQGQIDALDGKDSSDTTVDYEPEEPQTPEPDYTDNNNDYTETDEIETVQATTTNPFVAISFNTASYSSMLDALGAAVSNNEQSFRNAQSTITENKENIRNMFEEIWAQASQNREKDTDDKNNNEENKKKNIFEGVRG